MITLAELKAYLGIAAGDTSQDVKLQLIVNATNAYVEDTTLMNYSGADKTRSEVTDYRDNVYLGRMGIKTITNLQLYQTNTETATPTLDAKSYTFNNIGRLTLDQNYNDDYNRNDYNSVHVTYTYGLEVGETVPADLKLAALQFASEQNSTSAGGDSRHVKSESTGSYRIEFSDTSVFDNIIRKYRIPRV